MNGPQMRLVALCMYHGMGHRGPGTIVIAYGDGPVSCITWSKMFRKNALIIKSNIPSWDIRYMRTSRVSNAAYWCNGMPLNTMRSASRLTCWIVLVPVYSVSPRVSERYQTGTSWYGYFTVISIINGGWCSLSLKLSESQVRHDILYSTAPNF